MIPLAVIGGGITGLAAAYYARQNGVAAEVFEQSGHAGGVIRTDCIDGCRIEAGPDSFLAAKPAAMELIAELGLEHEVIGSNDHQRVTYIVRNRRLVAMPEGLTMMVPTRIGPMAASPLLGIATKLRMAAEYFRGPANLPERSVAQLIREHYGQEAVDYLAEPLLAGVYGGDPELLSASAVLPQFVAMEREYGSLTRGMLARRKTPSAGSIFRTLKGGMGQLIDALAARGPVRHACIRAVLERGGGYTLLFADGESISAQNVIVACPAPHASEVLSELDAALARDLAAIPYNSSITVAFGYRSSDISTTLPGFGFLVPKVERKAMAACTVVGNKFEHRVPPERRVLRCFLGANLLGQSDAEITSALRGEIAELIGIHADPIFMSVQRWPRSMAQYQLGHAALVARIRAGAARHPGLRLAGNAYDGIGIPDCIRSAREAVADLLN